MPFVIRKVEPRFLCRGHVPPGTLPGAGDELDSVSHGALTGCLKQLASVLTLAEDIFAELTSELTTIADRSGALRQRVDKIDERLGTIDPKKIPVPESDISTFASRKEHFRANDDLKTTLFTVDTRPKILRELYEAAAVVAVRSLDSISRDGGNNSTEMYLCTPVLGKKRPDVDTLDIESRVPAAIEDLRRWTSTEALGDVTVPPDCMSRILADTTDGDAVDHKLPSPEEQVQAVALKFPAELVAVDVSGRGFERMSIRRRSLLAPVGQEPQELAIKRRSRPRRPRGKRRNTIAGIDQKEIRQAIGGETTAEGLEEEETSPSTSSRAHRSASTDILGSKKESPSEKKSHFNTLKAWGMSRLKLISPKSNQNVQDSGVGSGSAGGSNQGAADQSGEELKQAGSPEETNIYETVTMRRRKEKFHERKPSSSSSSGKSTSSIPVSMPNMERQVNVKLRESAAQRRERRKGNREDAPHSSSGNWSASSESGRASIGSETTTTTHPPRSTTTASIGTSSTSLSHVRRPKGRDTSASSSVTSEGTLTPDIIHDITAVPFSDDGETSSVYSCDTEGYYTSFHVDSGLKTLREEEALPQSPLTKSCDLSPELASPIAENEYELFGRGSTSTTTSSAGTVCTTLLAPPPPERKSSLTVVAMVHGQNQNGGQSPDSGHNTSSSPVESASSPACTGRSCSEFEYSESSDLEGCERVERIRSKTAINASRIPSMCVITPPGSDDEASPKEIENFRSHVLELRNEMGTPGSVLMSATVGTSKMEVINGQDKNPYATVQTILPPKVSEEKTSENIRRNIQSGNQNSKTSPLSGVLGKLRCVLPMGKKIATTVKSIGQEPLNPDSGDYVTIADVRNNNNKRSDHTAAVSSAGNANSITRSLAPNATYANSDLFKKEAEYVSLSELPKKQDSSLERRRQGARVTLDSEGKVVYSSDSLRRRKGAHTTFNPGPFVKEGISPTTSPLLHRAQATVRAINRDPSGRGMGRDVTDGPGKSTPPTSPQLGKLIIRAPKSPERAPSPNYVRTPSTVVGPTSPTSPQKHLRGAYVNVQGEEDSALLAVPKESVSPDASCQQPPPYIEPPQFNSHIGNHENLQQTNLPPYIKPQHIVNYHPNENQQKHHQNYNNHHRHHNYDNRIHYKENNQQLPRTTHQINSDLAGRQVLRNYSKSDHRSLFDRHHHNNLQGVSENYARNQTNLNNEQQFFDQHSRNYSNNNNQQFHTLPSYRSPREIEPPRSITPDITRGLARGPLSTMHMMARRGQNIGPHKSQEVGNKIGNDAGKLQMISKNSKTMTDNFNHKEQRQTHNLNQELPVPAAVLRNRLIVPASLAAVGYRFVAAPVPSVVSDQDLKGWKQQASDELKHTALSPIAPSSNKTFQSSTPGKVNTEKLQQHLDAAPIRQKVQGQHSNSSSGRSTPLIKQEDQERNTPVNLVLSPTKSTMSNEELFAAIHKSKRRLNIKEEQETGISPTESNAAGQNQISTRHSWSPESQKTPIVPKTVNPPSTTSRLDFKRLLLQQSVKTGPTRLSAAEQLKLSRQQSQQQQQLYPQHQHQQLQQLHQQHSLLQGHQIAPPVTPVKVLSPRAAWRFQSPRSDVLSSTIIEDAAAEEKAMKPSPENPSPISRLNSKRQLDLCSDLPQDSSKSHVDQPDNKTPKNFQTQNSNACNSSRLAPAPRRNIISAYSEIDAAKFSGDFYEPSNSDHHRQNVNQTMTFAENRRANNQLARAQFLASFPATSTPTSTGQNKTFFTRHNRARSESPQHSLTQNVTRSPSAPTLETAL